MNERKYKVRAHSDHLTFEFLSVGPKGNILKIVEYQHMHEIFIILLLEIRMLQERFLTT